MNRAYCQACDMEDHVLLCNLCCTYLYVSVSKSLWTNVFFTEAGDAYRHCCVFKVVIIKH